MVSLYQYFEQNKWDNYVAYLTKSGLKANNQLYLKLSNSNIFPDDINKVLAFLYDYSFFSDEKIFNKWVNTKIKMLDNMTPIESTIDVNHTNSLREFLMRGI